MYNHEPADYNCPFCALAKGTTSDGVSTPDHVFYEDATTLAFISSSWWPNNSGHALAVPKQHFENIYDIPDDVLGDVYKTAKKVALAIKDVYKCEGISTRQHNEPAGYQSVWHFHTHIFPRYVDDELYLLQKENREASFTERAVYAKRLSTYFNEKS